MGNIFRRPAKEFTINDEKVMISPLKVGTLLRVQDLTKAISEAIAKLRGVPIQEFERIANSTPAPHDKDAEAAIVMEKTVTKAPELSMVSLVVRNRQEGIQALFDCLLKNDLLEEVLLTSVDKFKGLAKGELFDSHKDDSMDLPTALDYLIAIVEVNAGGFMEMGKFSRLQGMFQGAFQAAQKPEVKS